MDLGNNYDDTGSTPIECADASVTTRRGGPFAGRTRWIFDASTPGRKRVLDLARRAASSSCPVLILGPTGTGKEVLASDIHAQSGQAGGPFISVNCAAITSALFESEFFGHVRGAFTGAQSDKPGLVELANGGALFLDEVGELAMESQSKLLRFLAQGTYWPVGATSERRARVRILSATHRALDGMLGAAFREDLFYRLGVVVLRIPPLEPGDVRVIARSMAIDAMKRHEKHVPSEALTALANYCAQEEWRGGARELRNAIERFMVFWDGSRPVEQHCADVLRLEAAEPPSRSEQRASGGFASKNLETLTFLGLAEECHDVRELAQRTGRTVQSIYGRLKKLGLGPKDLGPTSALRAVIHHTQDQLKPDLPWIQSLLRR